MKPLLALISGFLAASAVFISGAAVATYLLMAEPVRKLDASQDAAHTERQMPGAVQAATQDVRQVSTSGRNDHWDPNAQDSEAPPDPRAPSSPPSEDIDVISTGSIGAPDEPDNAQPSRTPETLSTAHVEWCSANYRSYQPETNSYTAYSGDVRPCVSPYTAAGTMASNISGGEPHATHEGGILSAKHVQDCLSRYRSYRPEDNTYQPYGGGPRQQCR